VPNHYKWEIMVSLMTS